MDKVSWWKWPTRTDGRDAAVIGLFTVWGAYLWHSETACVLMTSMYVLVLVKDYLGERHEEQRRLCDDYLAHDNGKSYRLEPQQSYETRRNEKGAAPLIPCPIHGEISCLRWYQGGYVFAHPSASDAMRWASENPDPTGPVVAGSNPGQDEFTVSIECVLCQYRLSVSLTTHIPTCPKCFGPVSVIGVRSANK
jgi:hypothetical protein